MGVSERTIRVAGLDVALRAAGSNPIPVVYLHGVPTSSRDWVPFLDRTGGVAPDLPGFGRSSKPDDFDYSIVGYEQLLESLFDKLGFKRIRLVVHDWGAVGLAFAQRHPERIERLVVINSVPFLPGYKWHLIARLWRRSFVGETMMAWSTKATMRAALRTRRTIPPALLRGFVEDLWPHFDKGTRQAILRLYRSAPEPVLAVAGERLDAIRCPSLVVWGDRDAFLPTRFAQAYADRLGSAEVEIVAGAGHWPWLDRPEVIDRVASFLS